MLVEHSISLEQLAQVVLRTLPNILSLSFRPHGSEHHIEGLVADIEERLARPRVLLPHEGSNQLRPPALLISWSSRRLLLDEPPPPRAVPLAEEAAAEEAGHASLPPVHVAVAWLHA